MLFITVDPWSETITKMLGTHSLRDIFTKKRKAAEIEEKEDDIIFVPNSPKQIIAEDNEDNEDEECKQIRAECEALEIDSDLDELCNALPDYIEDKSDSMSNIWANI